MLSADHMRSFPQCFADIPDPRRFSNGAKVSNVAVRNMADFEHLYSLAVPATVISV